MGRSKPVRLSDIAARLSLSTVSISKALRDHSDISEETRARVKAMAAEMGYVPNLVARSLSSEQSKTLGVVVPKIAHTFFSAALDGIHECAAAQGYEIILTVSRENAAAERQHLEALLSMQVDGILISASQEPPDRTAYERVRDQGVPLVFFDRAVDGLSFSAVTVDDREGARRAIEHVLGAGHRRVVHLAGYAHVSIGRERRAGYEEALRARGLQPPPSWIVEGGFSETYGYHGLKEVLGRGVVPEAVFAVTFPVGLGAVDALRERGLEDEVQIIAFGNQTLNRYLKRPFISVHQPARTLGFRATSLLLEEIASEKDPRAQHITLPTRLTTTEDLQRIPYLAETRADADGS